MISGPLINSRFKSGGARCRRFLGLLKNANRSGSGQATVEVAV
jgi:hypothetical protein